MVMFVISIKNTHETSELHTDIPTLIIMVITPNTFEKISMERQEREKKYIYNFNQISVL